jgi:hypothetical protein
VSERLRLWWLWVILAIAGLALLIVAREVLIRRLWLPVRDSAVAELTPLEKRQDFIHLTRLARDFYPFAEAAVHEKGMDDVREMADDYIERAANTADNAAFVLLVREYMQRLEQGTGHSDILHPLDLGAIGAIGFSVGHALDKRHLGRQRYWWDLAWSDLGDAERYAHSDLTVFYRNGRYVVQDDGSSHGTTIPAGSILRTIDGVAVDEYVRQLQDQIWLRFDAHLHKPYSHLPTPFVVPGHGEDGDWLVELDLPDGTRTSVLLESKPGVRRAPPSPEAGGPNVVCRELQPEVGWIRVRGFSPIRDVESDRMKIEEFLRDADGRYRTLFIDIRGNSGGAPRYWEDVLFRPFLREPVAWLQRAMVRRAFMSRYGLRNRLNNLGQRHAFRPGEVRSVPCEDGYLEAMPYLDPADWLCYESGKRLRPARTYPFEGELFVLIDADCFSAADDFARAVEATGWGYLVGARTAGGAAVVVLPWHFSLPNSGIVVQLEVEMALTAEGEPGEIFGTAPETVLAPSAYPTPVPSGESANALLEDPWLRYVLDRLE